MASAEYQVHNTSGEVKYDAFPHGKSPCEVFKIDLSDISNTNGFNLAASNTRSDSNQEANKKAKFHALLSDTRDDNQLSSISPCEVDVSFSGLSVHRACEEDPKPTDFLDFNCPKSATKSMKFKDISECEGDDFLSDLLSSVTKNPSNHTGFQVDYDNFSLDDICVPKLHEKESSTSSNLKKELSSDSSAFDLSDILSSISVGTGNQSKSSSLKNSSIEGCDQTLSFDDFKISNPVSHIEKQSSIDTNQGNLSDILSSLDISNLNSNKSENSRKLDLSLNKKLNSPNKDVDEGFSGFNPLKPLQNQTSFSDFSIGDFGSIKIGDGNQRNKEEKQSTNFSFVPSFSKKDAPFSHIQDKDQVPTHERYSSSEDSGISLMDFLSSIENSKENSSTSEEDSDKSSSLGSMTPENQSEELEEIDLNFCMKTFIDNSNVESSHTRNNCGTSHTLKRFENANPSSQVNPLPLMHSISPVTSHKGIKGSLFTKSFTCESKRDPSLVHKVANIKADILNQAFGCQTPVNFHRKKPLPNLASYSDNPTITYPGRRLFDSAGVSVVC